MPVTSRWCQLSDSEPTSLQSLGWHRVGPTSCLKPPRGAGTVRRRVPTHPDGWQTGRHTVVGTPRGPVFFRDTPCHPCHMPTTPVATRIRDQPHGEGESTRNQLLEVPASVRPHPAKAPWPPPGWSWQSCPHPSQQGRLGTEPGFDHGRSVFRVPVRHVVLRHPGTGGIWGPGYDLHK